MDDLRFYVLFNSVLVISGRWEVDNERLCAMQSSMGSLNSSVVTLNISRKVLS